jgi:hypothetical protein
VADYFVAPDGEDANPGSEAQPWRGFSVGRIRSGDRVFFRRGGHWYVSNGLNFSDISNIHLGAYGEGPLPMLQGQNLWEPLLGLYGNVSLTVSYLALSDTYGGLIRAEGSTLIMRGVHVSKTTRKSATSGAAAGTYVKAGSRLVAIGCVVSDVAGEAFYVGEYTDPDDGSSAEIRDCVISGCGRDGVDLKLGTAPSVVEGNTIHQVALALEGGAGICLGGTGHVIRNNVITGVGDAGVTSTQAGIYVQYVDEVRPRGVDFVIEGNLISDVPDQGIYLRGNGHQVTGNAIAAGVPVPLRTKLSVIGTRRTRLVGNVGRIEVSSGTQAPVVESLATDRLGFEIREIAGVEGMVYVVVDFLNGAGTLVHRNDFIMQIPAGVDSARQILSNIRNYARRHPGFEDLPADARLRGVARHEHEVLAAPGVGHLMGLRVLA